jgi:hypothetical protein
MYDARDELWQKAFDAYYDTYYEEILSAATLRRWIWVDTITKLLVAITTASSAVAGWTLWSKPGFRELWLIVAGIAAILSIIHASLAVAERVRDWESIGGAFFNLRVQMEDFRNRMCIDPEFPIETFLKHFEVVRRRYVETVERSRDDILQTSRLKRSCQKDVNTRLSGEIIEREEDT